MLKLYHDSSLSNPIQSDEDPEADPDEVRTAVEAGQDVEEIDTIYLGSADEDKTYEDISLEMHSENGDGVIIDYREAGSTTWEDPLSIPDGGYRESEGNVMSIERRVRRDNLTEAQYTDTVKHRLVFSEYIDT